MNFESHPSIHPSGWLHGRPDGPLTAKTVCTTNQPQRFGASTRHETLDCCQEAEMFNDFSELVLNLKHPESAAQRAEALEKCAFWRRICLETQAVTDACMESGRADAALVRLAPRRRQSRL